MVFDELWKDGITKDRIAAELHIPLDELESLVGELVSQSPPPVAGTKKPMLKIVS